MVGILPLEGGATNNASQAGRRVDVPEARIAWWMMPLSRWVENPYCRVPRSRRVRADATVSMMGDEASRSRPAGVGFKPLHAAASKRRGGERWRKGGARRRQLSDEKMSASEPLTTHRNGFNSCQNGREVSGARTSVDATCLRATRQPVYRRHDLITGVDMERGNLAWDAKGNPQVAHTTRENTDPASGAE